MICCHEYPLKDIDELRQVVKAIKSGPVFDPAKLEAAMGMTR